MTREWFDPEDGPTIDYNLDLNAVVNSILNNDLEGLNIVINNTEQNPLQMMTDAAFIFCELHERLADEISEHPEFSLNYDLQEILSRSAQILLGVKDEDEDEDNSL